MHTHWYRYTVFVVKEIWNWSGCTSGIISCGDNKVSASANFGKFYCAMVRKRINEHGSGINGKVFGKFLVIKIEDNGTGVE